MINYLMIPLNLLDKLNHNSIVLLSQLVYMKKAFKELNPSNAYLSKKLNLSDRTIRRSLALLHQLNYITVEIKNNYQRQITITSKAFNAYGIIDTKNNEKSITAKNNSVLKQFLVS